MANIESNRYKILGVGIDAITMDEAVKRILSRLKQPGSVYVTKPYVEFLDRAKYDGRVRDLLNQSFLVLPDAVSLQWASTYLYKDKPGLMTALKRALQIVTRPSQLTSVIPERFAGTNFTWKLLEACAENNKKVYLVGGPDTTFIQHTAKVIGNRLPKLQICGLHSGTLGGKWGDELYSALNTSDVEKELVADIRVTKPDIILVGMGFPLQEALIAKIAPQLNHGVLIGEGGTFDYDSFGGSRRKAPVFMQKIGLEWLWRLTLEPRRIGRQMAIPRFMRAVYHQSQGR